MPDDTTAEISAFAYNRGDNRILTNEEVEVTIELLNSQDSSLVYCLVFEESFQVFLF